MKFVIDWNQYVSIEHGVRPAYMAARGLGRSHDEAFSYAAYKAACRTTMPFKDEDVLHFVRINPYEHKVSNKFDQQVFYWEMRKNGESHRFSEAMATRSFPGVRGTDSDFMKGSHIQDSPLDAYRHKVAQQQGVDTNGKRYIAGMARFPGDPEAWVSGTSDVLRLCRDRGWNCHGAVEYEAPDAYQIRDEDRDLKAPVAKDVVQEAVADRLSNYDVGDITPRLAMDITEQETKRLNGDENYTPRVKDYSFEDSIAISEGD